MLVFSSDSQRFLTFLLCVAIIASSLPAIFSGVRVALSDADTEPPKFVDGYPTHSPTNPQEGQSVTITASATDAGGSGLASIEI